MPPMDISNTDCFLVRWVEGDLQPVTVTVEANSTLGNSLNVSLVVNMIVESPGVDFCLPYPPNTPGLDSVEGVDVSFASTDSADNLVGYFCAASSVSCWHTIDFMGNDPDMLQAGSTIGFQVTCLNYYSLPETVQNISINFSFPSFGTMDSGSLQCRGHTMQDISGNDFSASAILDERENITCSFNVDLDMQGDSGDLNFIITNQNRMTQFRSTANGNNAGTQQFCQAPTASAFQVQPPPPPSSVSGDPHFRGFLGQRYDFHGVRNTIYNIITSKSFQMNSLFYDADLNPQKKKTYLGAIGMRICDPKGDNLFYFKCDRINQEHVVQVNNKELKPGEQKEFQGATIKRSKLSNSKVSINIMSGYDIDIRFSQSSHSSCHLNIRCTHFTYSETFDIPHGILGQSVMRQPNIVGKGWNSPNIVEGSEYDYVIEDEDIFGTSFKYNRYDDKSECAVDPWVSIKGERKVYESSGE